MTKHLRLFMLMLLALVCMGGYSQETKSVVCTLAKDATASTCTGEATLTLSYSRVGDGKNDNGVYWNCSKGEMSVTAKLSEEKAIITKIELNAKCSNKAPKMSVSVGGNSFGKTVDLTTGNSTYTFEGKASGDITINFTGKAEKNPGSYFLKTITVYYTIASDKKDPGIKFEKDSYTADITKDSFDGAVLTNPNNLTVVYSISPDDALIDKESGYIIYTKGKEATYTVTATFAGNDTYKPATASYTLTIVDPNYEVKTVTFDATVDKGSTFSTNADEMSKDKVTISSTSAAFNPNNSNDYRFYGKGTKHTFTTAAGNITKIEFEGDDTKHSLTNIKLDEGISGAFNPEALKATWTGNAKEVVFTTTAQARATKIIVTIKAPVAKDFDFAEENTDNAIEDYDNANVMITRPLVADGGWNTLCLPFSLTAEQIKGDEAFGADAELREIDTDNSKGNTIVFKEATSIKAGVPYLIKGTKFYSEGMYMFEGVILSGAAPKEITAGEGIVFTGLYNKTEVSTIKTEGNKVAALGDNNQLFNVTSGAIKGFRAYFLLPEGAQTQAIKVVIDGTATGIGDLQIDGTTMGGRVYNLAGQCVGTSLDNLKAGVYIQNGKKVIKK